MTPLCFLYYYLPFQALRISNTARKTTTTGEVVNLMSVDAERLSDSMIFIHFLWVTPFTVVITMIFIYQKLGPSSLVGLAYLVIVLPLNSWLLGRFTRKYQVRVLSELFLIYFQKSRCSNPTKWTHLGLCPQHWGSHYYIFRKILLTDRLYSVI